jgi:hypothetical protein
MQARERYRLPTVRRDRIHIVLGDYVPLYVRLRHALAQPVRRALSEQVRSSKPASRTPENVPAQDAMDALVAKATGWGIIALSHAGLGTLHPMGRESIRLVKAVDALLVHDEGLCRLSIAEEYEADITHARQRALRALHAERLVHRLDAPCPECNCKALIRHDGQDRIKCAVCGTSWDERAYHLLVHILVEEARNGTATTGEPIRGSAAGRREA